MERKPIHLQKPQLTQIPLPNGGWGLGDREKRETLCIGSFGDSGLGDTYNDGEEIFILVKADGTMQEAYRETEAKVFPDGSYTVKVKFGSFFVIPYEISKA